MFQIILTLTIYLFSSTQLSFNADAEEFKIISFEEFETMINQESSNLRIYNFWATWCAPCIKEMPYFEKAQAENPIIELIFISMDDARKPDRVTSFIEKRAVGAPVFLLDDVDYNSWIDKVSTDWSGAIPATLFIQADGTRHFVEGELEEEELNEIIQKLNQ